MFKCISSSNEVRTFPTYEEAHRFALREGGKGLLWSLDIQASANHADIIETAMAVARRYHGNPTASSALSFMIFEALVAERKLVTERAKLRDKLILEALTECAEYFSQRSDADCDQDGFIPNEENKLLMLVDDAIAGFHRTHQPETGT